MTKQEAIIMLKGIKAEYLDLDNVYIKDRHDALNVAIEMLEKKVSEPWCEGCKEYDKEQHCCHRYTNFIRYSLNDNINAVLEDVKEKISLPFEPISNDRTVVAYYKGIQDGLGMARDVIDEHMKKEN